ncbi:MAG: putative DNA binding domain-containing protein [Bacteroidales bacterium]|nr:putative DNA binding domain-containing protein [Bacteroidales bacterium]
MTLEQLQKLIAKKEGTEIEFKESKDKLARSVYESICAFLNRRGGYVVLGASDSGKIVGINPDKVQEQLDTLAKDMNNPELFKPTYYLDFNTADIDGKKVIYFYVPESSQAHSYKGVYYDRNQDGDFELRGTEQIANLFIRKSRFRTENRVFPEFSVNDLDENAFDAMRTGIRIENAKHPWLTMSNEEILHSGEMILIDHETGKEGLTLAAILLFGTERTIAIALPTYSIDMLCRINNTELYDDRALLRCNLMKAYPIMMDFIKKHLPEQPYIEGIQRFSLRDMILREVVLNLIIHREYSSSYPASFTIYRNSIVSENWNIPFAYGLINPLNMKPHRKNPTIAKVFSQMGIVEELGSGTRKMFKYTPLYADGKEPIIEEQDVYRIEIPYIPTLHEKEPESGKKVGRKWEEP